MDWYEIDIIGSHDRGPYVIIEESHVPGGRLVRMVGYTHDGLPSLGVSITFVPWSHNGQTGYGATEILGEME